MKVGDLVWFPCEAERYQPRLGIWMGNHDNRTDIGDSAFAHRLKNQGRRPRQVADILYKGKMVTCWAVHVRMINDNV